MSLPVCGSPYSLLTLVALILHNKTLRPGWEICFPDERGRVFFSFFLDLCTIKYFSDFPFAEAERNLWYMCQRVHSSTQTRSTENADGFGLFFPRSLSIAETYLHLPCLYCALRTVHFNCAPQVFYYLKKYKITESLVRHFRCIFSVPRRRH